MNTMIQAVGKTVIQDNADYEEAIFKQNKLVIDRFVEELMSNIKFDVSQKVR